MIKAMDAERFRRDVAAHQMTVLLDCGVYRHLKFRNAPPNSWNMWFELVTWPGSLAINGDMGTWTFARIDDMFQFFRSDELRINCSYWHEKMQSDSRFGGPAKQFTPEQFEKNVISSLENYDLPESQRADIILALHERGVLGEDHEATAHQALADFAHGDFTFSDPWEISGHGYAYHFLWCLHAIVWGIQQYDREKGCRDVNNPMPSTDWDTHGESHAG